MPRRAAERIHRFEITSAGDRHMLEALQLEIRRLARKHGFEVSEVRIAEVGDEDEGPRPAA